MALSVNTNVGAMSAMSAASAVNNSMETSMERLSTGKRINAASDDAAGVAIASRLESEIRGTNQAVRNAMDAQALIDTAEGAHVEIVDLLQRMREVAVQAANDTNGSDDRTALTKEMTAMTAEINRIANVTTWAGKVLLDGASPDASKTTETGNASFSFHIGSGTTAADKVAVNIGAMGGTALGIAGSALKPTSATVVSETTSGTVTISADYGTITVAKYKDADTIKLNINGTEVSITSAATGDAYEDSELGTAAQLKAAIDAANIAGLVVTDNGDKTLTLAVGGALDITTASKANTAISTIDNAIKTVNAQRAELGAVSNRLDSTVDNLTNISVNLAEGKGRIEDADFAGESTNLAKQQILQQAATSMLAQANASKQSVLSLLQG